MISCTCWPSIFNNEKYAFCKQWYDREAQLTKYHNISIVQIAYLLSDQYFIIFVSCTCTRLCKIKNIYYEEFCNTMGIFPLCTYVSPLEVCLEETMEKISMIKICKGFLYQNMEQLWSLPFFENLLGHLSHSGNLLQWDGVRRRPSCIVRYNLLFKTRWANLKQNCYVASVRRLEIFKFHDPPHPKER